MQPSASSTSRVPPGFARPLTVGEVPLMAHSSHNKPSNAPPHAKNKYTMLLPSKTDTQGVRGYHGLRFVRLRRLYSRQQLQRLGLLLSLAVVGLLLLLWQQVTLPLLERLQQLRALAPFIPSAADLQRCDELHRSPRAYAQGELLGLSSAGRRELLQEVWGAEGRKAERMRGSAGAPLNLLSAAQHDGIFAFFEMITRALDLKGVSWALAGNSLVGSLAEHDMLRGDRYIAITVSKEDKGRVRESCNLFNPSNELLQPKLYQPHSLLSWLVNTNKKPKFEEQALNSPFGLISLDTSTAADGLRFPPLAIRVYWYKEVRDRSPDDPEDWEPYVEIGSGMSAAAANQKLPLEEMLPFQERPFGLLSVPTPRNPLFYLNRFYNTADPLCAALQQQEKAAAAAATAAGEMAAAAESSAASGQLSFLAFSLGRCGSTTSIRPPVRCTPINAGCLKESFVVNGEEVLEVYTSSRYSPAPEFSSWLPPTWR